ncbi:MAG: amidohydrolase [Firmicutes bacterium RBG_13_65_8]|nr:MAG: amidohydrolase [Firmicutes bacterium RBG_13_65_8]
MAGKADSAIRHIDRRSGLITGLSDAIWEYAEVALHEDRSARVLADALKAEGFEVETGAGGMPTAFVATWGSGCPVIGFLGEYDALAGLSQKPLPVREPLVEGAPGHGCAHNLLGAGTFGAAIGLKAEMQARRLPGTIRYYGCPAEENLSGKAFMARDGVFDDCDACITWHPSEINRVWSSSSLANNAANFTFYGRSAHAAGDPHNGRSALDAVQLMNLGVEFLREHVPSKARMHYVISNGGGQPNVVPPVARVWYLIRSPLREEVDELWERVLKCANGAAEMTETKYEIELLKAIWNVLTNKPLEDVLDAAFKRVGPPAFGQAEREFAAEIAKSIPASVKRSALRAAQVPEEIWDQDLNDTILDRPAKEEELMGSTDVGDVSWCCPTAQFGTSCAVMGTPGHSWQNAAQAGMGIGHAGMLTAAKVMAEAGLELITSPEALAAAKREFLHKTGGRPYMSAMPPGQKPAFHQFA